MEKRDNPGRNPAIPESAEGRKVHGFALCGDDQWQCWARKGYGYTDFHVHTWHSYDVIPSRTTDPLYLYRKARQLGFRFVIFTDHDTMDAYDRVGWTREGIVPGVELKILDKKRVGHTIHINVYGLDRRQFRQLMELTKKDRNVENLVRYLKENQLAFVFNHPFWYELNEKPNLQSIIDVSTLFPVLEYNMGRLEKLNRLAMQLAARNRAGLLAGSDSHIGQIGKTLTLARGEDFQSFFSNIKSNRSLIVPRNMDVQQFTLEVMERYRAVFEDRSYLDKHNDFHLQIGNPFVDDILKKIKNCVENDRLLLLNFFIKSLVKLILKSRIPASLYLRGQRIFASRAEAHLINAGTLKAA